jgi:hypothetical protein
MKSADVFEKRMIYAISVGAILISCIYQSAGAGEPPKDVSKEIDALRGSITSIDLYTITTPLSFRVGLKEQDVVRMGCAYKVTEKDDVSTLMDVLVGAQLIEPAEKIPTLEPRIVAYLHTREGAVTSLVLTHQFRDDPVRGTYNANTLVMAKMGFGAALVQWRKEHKPARWDELTCNDA